MKKGPIYPVFFHLASSTLHVSQIIAINFVILRMIIISVAEMSRDGACTLG